MDHLRRRRATITAQPIISSSIICPNCGFRRLIDSGLLTVSETFIPGQNGYESADYYQKCSRCNEEIGIKKLK